MSAGPPRTWFESLYFVRAGARLRRPSGRVTAGTESGSLAPLGRPGAAGVWILTRTSSAITPVWPAIKGLMSSSAISGKASYARGRVRAPHCGRNRPDPSGSTAMTRRIVRDSSICGPVAGPRRRAQASLGDWACAGASGTAPIIMANTGAAALTTRPVQRTFTPQGLLMHPSRPPVTPRLVAIGSSRPGRT